MVHKLKTWVEYFSALQNGSKTFELRKNDRGFKLGDRLVAEEWNHITKEHTGNEITFRITYVLTDATEFGLQSGYCILGLRKLW